MTLFQWTGKIYYGLLYKEYFLPRNRTDGSKATIVTREMPEGFKLNHFFLQSIKRPIEFHGNFPASIFVHRIQCARGVRRQFNFRDLHHFLGISIQPGAIGIIAVLQDGGVQADILGDTHRSYYELNLHPLQFAELTARTFYKATLMNRTPKYTIAEGAGRITVIQLPIMGFSARPIYDEWNNSHYAWVLSEHTHYSPDVVSPAPDQVITWLRNDRGDFLQLDVETDIWP